MLSLANLKRATLAFLALALLGWAAGLATCPARADVADKAQTAKPTAGGPAAPEKKETVTATLKIKKDPAVFAAGEAIAFDVILKYTGDKPQVGLVEVNRFWTFRFTPLDGGVPRTAVLIIKRSKVPAAPGGGPLPPLAPLPLEEGKERSRSFVLNQGGESSHYAFADARKSLADQKKTLLSELPPGKYSFTASHDLPVWKGNKSPDNWYQPVTANAVQIEITAKP